MRPTVALCGRPFSPARVWQVATPQVTVVVLVWNGVKWAVLSCRTEFLEDLLGIKEQVTPGQPGTCQEGWVELHTPLQLEKILFPLSRQTGSPGVPRVGGGTSLDLLFSPATRP
jgi:hypothetical protein